MDSARLLPQYLDFEYQWRSYSGRSEDLEPASRHYGPMTHPGPMRSPVHPRVGCAVPGLLKHLRGRMWRKWAS